MTGWEGSNERIMPLAETLAHTMGFEVLLVEPTMEQGKRVLRIYLDKPGEERGVTVDECADFSRALGPILEVEANLGGRYNLEISSPGLNRPLVKAEHFQAQEGKIVELHTRESIEGRHHFKGRLKKVLSGDPVILEIVIDDKEFKIPLTAVKKAHLDYFTSETPQKGEKRVLKFKKK